MPVPPPTGPLVTRSTLIADLRALGVRPGDTLLLHSSLSALGWVCGGAVSVVQGLLHTLGPDGTLTVPTHTGGNSDPAQWRRPPVPQEWWAGIRASMPAYDMAVTPSEGMGVIAETARRWPGALRSAHPQTSFAAVGPQAAAITHGHATDCSLGEDSPLARLEERDARVLLLGTRFATCTSFHLAEYRIPSPRRTVMGRAVLTPDGGRRWETVTEIDISADGFDELGAALERDGGVVRGRVGAADARLFPVADAVAYAQEWLARHRS
ncbi:aminoglycoside N(3)-acetyltransferase [Streptomyces sp. NPDC055059]|jgi:aminoglycoside 3-N-acetyltransferase|uniref:aminoglycoside N(3)-acetyltransferase n=1 Tax=Streptomyces sp. NPDC127172 TaxID=3345382 RepID=UPI00363A85BF